jgi:hypothetical protein
LLIHLLLFSVNLPYRDFSFHVPNLMSILCCLGHSKESESKACVTFCNMLLCMVRSCWSPTQLLSWRNTSDCLFNIVTATAHIWRPSPPSTSQLAMLWWEGPPLHRPVKLIRSKYILLLLPVLRFDNVRTAILYNQNGHNLNKC